LSKREELIDEATDPLPDRRLGAKSDRALEIGCIGTGLRDIAGAASGGAPAPRGLAHRALDQLHHLHDLDRLVSCSTGEKMPRLWHGKTSLQQARLAAERRRECGSTAR
jgi:hypothetical protein